MYFWGRKKEKKKKKKRKITKPDDLSCNFLVSSHNLQYLSFKGWWQEERIGFNWNSYLTKLILYFIKFICNSNRKFFFFYFKPFIPMEDFGICSLSSNWSWRSKAGSYIFFLWFWKILKLVLKRLESRDSSNEEMTHQASCFLWLS